MDEPLPENAWQNHVYENRAPWWGDDSSWFQVDIALAPSVRQDGSQLLLLCPLRFAEHLRTAQGKGIVLDLSKLPKGKKVTAVKYGQGIPGMLPQSGHKRVCCGTRDISVNPCPPDACPVSSVGGALPAMPFLVAVGASGACEGVQPQVVTGLG